MLKHLSLALAFVSTLSLASVIETSGTPAGSIEGVSVLPTAKAAGATLKLTGAGIRKKKIVFVKVKVYVAASYIDAATKFDPQNPMASFEAANVKALRLTFLRDIGASTIRDGFIDSLKANGIDPETPLVKKTMGQLTFDVKKGQSLTLLGKKEGGVEVVSWELPEATITEKGDGAATLFWKIWFGKPGDGGIADLKEHLVSGKVSEE